MVDKELIRRALLGDQEAQKRELYCRVRFAGQVEMMLI